MRSLGNGNVYVSDRFASDSPTSDIDGRTPKGRGKRGRTCVNVTRSDMNSSDRKLRSNRCATGGKSAGHGGSTSPVRSESGGGTMPPKRPRGVDAVIPASANNSDGSRANSKSSRSDSRMSNNAEFDGMSGNSDASLIECPAPNCSKKYRHTNGLRYHQSRSHPDMVLPNDVDDEINNEEGDGFAKSTDSELLQRASSKFPSRPRMADDADSVSDSDIWQAGANDDGSAHQPLMNDSAKSEKKSKSKMKTGSAAESMDVVPGSPSGHKLVPSKSSSDETPGREKSKHRKKDRIRSEGPVIRSEGPIIRSEGPVIRSEGPVPVVMTESVVDSDLKLASVSVSSDVRSEGAVASESSDPSVMKQSPLDSISHGSDALPVSDATASDGHFLSSISSGNGAFVSTMAQSKTMDMPDSVPSFEQLSGAGSMVLGKKMKGTTPVKLAPDQQNNPNSPAYSDISDANDAAPMLEKEATPSAPLDDEEILPSSNVGGEQRPLSRHVPDTFNGSFSGTGSTLYGQPPCLTPAVASASTEDSMMVKQPNIAHIETPNAGGVLPDDRLAARTNPPLPRPQMGAESGGRTIAEGPSELDRSSQRQAPRFPTGGDPRSSPLPPSVFPPQMLMAYQYVNPNLDAAMLMQHPDYRAHYERLIQQEVTRRHDSPSAAHSAHQVPSPDVKGSPASRPPGELDRRSLPAAKGDPLLPTPPSLIPDRFDDSESRRKMKERRDDTPRVYPAHQHSGGQHPAGPSGDRIRRQEEASLTISKDGPGGKPSAVVAPQARDRNASVKLRPDDRPRPTGGPPPPSPHDPNRNKSTVPKGIPTSHLDVPRTLKDVEKSGSSRSGQPYKTKDELPGTPSSVPNVPPSLAMSYAPYYPYLPGAPQYAAAAGLPYDPTSMYPGINPSIIGYAGTSGPPPGAFLHTTPMGYLPGSSAPPGDVPKIMSPAGAPMVSPPDAKSRDGPGRNFFVAGDGPPTGPSVHKIHELKEVAKATGGAGPLDVIPPASAGTPTAIGSRELPRPDSRGSGGAKDHERGSPPMQRHLHTHHHMHMLGPPLFSGVFTGDRKYYSSIAF